MSMAEKMLMEARAHFEKQKNVPGQLCMFDSVPRKKSEPLPVVRAGMGDKLRSLADGLQKTINSKRSTFSGCNLTRRRAGFIESANKEADKLERIQSIMRRLADMHEAGDVPDLLKPMTSKAIIWDALTWNSVPKEENQYYKAEYRRFMNAGIDTDEKLKAVKEALKSLDTTKEEDPTQAKIRKLEQEVLFSKIQGFFPTPPAVVDRLLELANLHPSDFVLEPSAGKGNIADRIREIVGDRMHVCEYNLTLSHILHLKGYNRIKEDFFQLKNGGYDKIVMNPPFENLQDIDHVRHAYDNLVSGGRLVSIMSASPFFRSDKKAVEFREWLEDIGGGFEQLPEGSFKSSEKSTGVNTYIVVIDK